MDEVEIFALTALMATVLVREVGFKLFLNVTAALFCVFVERFSMGSQCHSQLHQCRINSLQFDLELGLGEVKPLIHIASLRG